MQISNRNKTVIAGIITKDKVSDSRVKYENIYNIIWPLDRFVLKRIIRVKGRISWEKISTIGKNNIKATGDPYGNIWAINDLNWVENTQTIIGTQNNKERVNVCE